MTHEKVHTGEKVSRCKQYSRCSGQLRSLRRHKNAHNDAANCGRDKKLIQTPFCKNLSQTIVKHPSVGFVKRSLAAKRFFLNTMKII